ncbi:hypothetical protein BKA67DRAFT_541967 [Truncatella angustata]|uniref:Uncharacterized protein n=1 Tax=Truncatella angustata TaxID=152316 RepID=A0A9P8U895_9PEZI|nr:uncharacterized protein BKA67DRAFT_541967 [Truncatella angustata]KAH6644974.1 hypothetical protein BKA67DRAFT_541967 [Truncatella angustata]
MNFDGWEKLIEKEIALLPFSVSETRLVAMIQYWDAACTSVYTCIRSLLGGLSEMRPNIPSAVGVRPERPYSPGHYYFNSGVLSLLISYWWLPIRILHQGTPFAVAPMRHSLMATELIINTEKGDVAVYAGSGDQSKAFHSFKQMIRGPLAEKKRDNHGRTIINLPDHDPAAMDALLAIAHARDCTAGDDDLCWERFLFIAWELGDAGWAKELIMMLAMSDTSKPLYFLQFDSITGIDTQDDCNTYRKGQFEEQFWNRGWTSIPTTEEWRGDPITLLLELSAFVPKPIKSHKGLCGKKTRNDFELEM